MLYESILRSDSVADRLAVVDRNAPTTWGALAECCRQQRAGLAGLQGRRVAVRLPATAQGLAVLAALDDLEAHAFLLDAQLPAAEYRVWVDDLQLAAVLHPPADPDAAWKVEALDGGTASSTPGGVTILTSGTEGKPKAATHTWRSLAQPVRRTAAATPQRWMLSYRIHLYAGLQVVLQALLNYGLLAVPEADASPDEIMDLMGRHGVQYGSATPSFWRRLLLFADRQRLRRLDLVQLTLGGETVDQQILDELRNVFPEARLIHIYATTELGRCFAVRDGRAGFPAAFLEGAPEPGIELRVCDGQLQVRSANAMRQYERPQTTAPGFDRDGWFDTGDLVHIEGDRVYFKGRAGDLINVGGNKVAPGAVEAVIRQVEGVADVRVYGQPSSLAGQLVACDLVLRDGAAEADVRGSVATACGSQLAAHHRPRIINIVDRLPLNAAGKTRRDAPPSINESS